jgi:hypothetical protein
MGVVPMKPLITVEERPLGPGHAGEVETVRRVAMPSASDYIPYDHGNGYRPFAKEIKWSPWASVRRLGWESDAGNPHGLMRGDWKQTRNDTAPVACPTKSPDQNYIGSDLGIN